MVKGRCKPCPPKIDIAWIQDLPYKYIAVIPIPLVSSLTAIRATNYHVWFFSLNLISMNFYFDWCDEIIGHIAIADQFVSYSISPVKE